MCGRYERASAYLQRSTPSKALPYAPILFASFCSDNNNDASILAAFMFYHTHIMQRGRHHYFSIPSIQLPPALCFKQPLPALLPVLRPIRTYIYPLEKLIDKPVVSAKPTLGSTKFLSVIDLSIPLLIQ